MNAPSWNFPKSNLAEEYILITGAGVTGRSTALILSALGAQVALCDDRVDIAQEVAQVAVIKNYPGKISALSVSAATAQLAEFSGVVCSPGWRPDTPVLLAASSQGLEVIGDVELAWRLDRMGQFGAPRKWVAITGTNGKTTTTAMVEKILQAGNLKAQAVGNIGTPILEVLSQENRVDILVAELSSFQLHWCADFIPDAGVLLNLAEDHLDWHGSMAAYADAKAKVLRGEIAVVDPTDELVGVYSAPIIAKYAPTVLAFSNSTVNKFDSSGVGTARGVNNLAAEQLSVTLKNPETGFLTYKPILDTTAIHPAGPAGISDAAAAAVIGYFFAKLEPAIIAQALANFQVAAHRGQVVHQDSGISWVDNSKATNPHAAAEALAGYNSVIWIAGGQLKGAQLGELLAKQGQRLKAVAVLGVDREAVLDAIKTAQSRGEVAGNISLHSIDTTDPELAMQEAVIFSQQQAQPGDTVLLAPAAASLDMYSGMGQRGDLFAKYARLSSSK
ncbi:UDP-N-acetylmuramoyl-L-alanine--D-glutamate ligase [Corynebacterium caspium]|uniref:UDP-N-acetylmuramoyl-L-alanine--D-glutamate ligase n=1 Tax=Corynebacterium caspium TaxID=234828 RepID=UPI00036E37BE|nr:UDP-N-acetylmuramoyl-L-alanine--D-glutamate ligase [Corynebacterium caspium]WKD58994.1 UDP-N-acetylmuramoylalanine--D-glutamate ligase [Corynebacterium caspium DSM 44850]